MVQSKCADLMDHPTVNRNAKAMHDMLRWFASTQIRNVACLGGNLVTGSPISDMNPLLACMGAKVIISSIGDDEKIITRRSVAVSDFFLSYRKVDLGAHELIEYIEVPIVKPVFEYIFPFKQARRREDDISIVTSGMRIRVEPEIHVGYRISEVSIAFGGMAAKTILATATAQSLQGKIMCEGTAKTARMQLQSELDIPENAPGGQGQYRKTLASSFFHRFFLLAIDELERDIQMIRANNHISDNDSSQLPDAPTFQASEKAGEYFLNSKKPSSFGTQSYPPPIAIHEQRNTLQISEVGKSGPHVSAPLHCTGEAVYVDDMPVPHNILFSSLILAKNCSVTFHGVKTDRAIETPGVVSIFFHEDIVRLNGDNVLGPILHDEYVFLPIGEKVSFIGQVLGICIAETHEAAELGARSVEVSFSDVEREIIVSIDDAIKAGSFYESSNMILERNNHDVAIEEDDEIVEVEGTFRSGGQEHFYLETNATLVVPSESSTHLTVYASTQNPTETQKHCALATNTPASNVVVRMKRMGGGFGGKETRSVFISCAVAVAAKLSGRPVKLSLTRDVDMSITGGRHSFMTRYRASAVKKPNGEVKLYSVQMDLFSNGGSAFDLSGPIMARALFHVDGTYYWSKFKAVGLVCKTVQPPHTAFRGFGGPQGMAICEHIIDHLSSASRASGYQIRKDNLYREGQYTPFGMKLGSGPWNIPRMWDRLMTDLHVAERCDDIKDFNRLNSWTKRGAALTPTKFGIAFTAKFMNQGGALVHLYTDGTVLVSHGGTEMVRLIVCKTWTIFIMFISQNKINLFLGRVKVFILRFAR
jgi:xanthine dehydrogenase/oxidase